MPTRLHLAAGLLLITGAATPRAHTQTIHSPQVTLHHKQTPEDLSWLWQYTQPAPGSRENAMLWDPKFKPFLQQHLTAPQSFWNHGQPLPDVALEFLGVPGEVFGDDNRYLNADGCVPHFCPDRGLLWVDTGTPHPLVIFSAIEWISDSHSTDESQAAYTLWLFPDRALSPAHLPAAFHSSIARWTAKPSSGSTALQNITRVLLVDPDGTPHTIAPADLGAHNFLPPETTTEPESKVNP